MRVVLDTNVPLAIAEVAHADWLVTGDKSHLLGLKKYGATRIVTARPASSYSEWATGHKSTPGRKSLPKGVQRG